MKRFDEKTSKEVIQKEVARLSNEARRRLNRVTELTGLLTGTPVKNMRRPVVNKERTPRSKSVKNLVFQALAKSKHLPTEKVVDAVRSIKPDVNPGTVAASLSSLKRDGVVSYKDHEYFATAKQRKAA